MKIGGLILGLLCIIGVMALIGGVTLLSLHSLILITICPFFIVLGNFKAKDILNSFKDALYGESVYDEKRLISSCVILKLLSLFTIIFGIMGTLIEFTIILAHANEPKDIPPLLGTSLLPIFYALLLSLLVYAPLSKSRDN